ncbi:Alpha/Beta hydrolase protein [Mycena maculata]|uniref:Alpha/Beta hydrolase protein n=1 Tax=Mycena maculata TaxID=230809 RepID=A0AAD7JYE8_9AGAR|nr:Alpha/Beta hydrolase protein [Mycena maculata]
MTTSSIFLSNLLWFGQPYLVYPSAFLPRPRLIKSPEELGLSYSDLRLMTSDGAVLHCYLLRHEEQSSLHYEAEDGSDGRALGTVIMFHGNGSNYGDGIYAASKLLAMRVNVLMLSYRGYGRSEGIPSEIGLRLDAQAALDYVGSDTELSARPTILYGTSLGGAVAIDLASRNPSMVSALMIENTFTSIADVVHGLPLLGPFSFLCTQKWESAAKVPLIPRTTPILMLSGTRDEVVPKAHMEALWAVAQRRGRGDNPNSESELDGTTHDRFESFANGLHCDTITCPGYWDKIGEFLGSVTGPRG